MKLTDQDIAEYAQLWQEELGETLSYDEARQEASRTMDLFHLVATLTADQAREGTGPPLPHEILPVLSQVE